MSYKLDVLKSTLPDLVPGFIDNFTNWHPLTKYIKDSGGFDKRKAKGPWVEFNVITGGPGATDAVYSGGEVFSSTINNMLQKGTEYPHRFVYHYAIPKKMIDELETEYDFANLIEALPEQAVGDLMEGVNSQIVRGAFSAGTNDAPNGTKGITTLNGSQSYFPQDGGTGRTGIFQFAAPASQTATVHGLAMQGAANGVKGWFHQYGVITDFATDGRPTLETVRDKANRQGAKADSSINLILSDPGSRQQYVNSLDAQVRLAMVDLKGERVPDGIRDAIKFGNADWFSDDAIDITDTTAFTNADAQDGVAYLLNTKYWELFTIGKGKRMFEMEDLMPNPFGDSVIAHIVNYWNIYCTNLRAQGCVTGGNR